MPGPSSPKTKQKVQLAKEKQRRERPGSPILRPPHKDYRPADDCIIWKLSEYLTEREKRWWDEFIGKDKSFDQHRGPRGSHNGAMAWVRGKFCTEWWPEFYPQYPEVSNEDKIYYFTNRKIGGRIYSYLHNTTKRQNDETKDSSGKAGSSTKPKTTLSKPARLKKKVLPHDLWRRSNPEAYRARVDKYTTENGEPSFGRLRALSSDEFKELPAAERAKWEKKAKEELKKAREAVKLTDPNERAEFVKDYMKEFRIMLDDLEQRAGVKMCALILQETSEGKYRLTRELSDSIKDFGKSPALVSSMGAFQKWYQDTADTTVDNPIPLPTVYPDYANNCIPLLPDFAGITLDPARHLMRTYTNAVFRFQGAVGKVMWKEIKEDLKFWLDPALLPEEFDDPSHLALPVVLVWLDFFRQGQRQEADAPAAPQLWFRRVPAGLNPIDKSESQEVAREEGTYKGKKSVILVFDRPVTRCHHPDGMNYSEDSRRYADFLNSGSMEPDLDEIDLPEEWMGLPIPGTDTPELLIPGAVKGFILDLANRLPEAQAQLVTRLLQAADEHTAHFPATHPQGVYQEGERPPKLIPPSPDSDSWPISMWPHSDYFKHPSKAAPDGTVSQYELWQEHAAKVLVHEPSGTLYGGKNGVICVVRSLIQLLFTFSAVRGDFDPPEPMPEDYNAARFPVNEWPLLLQWVNDWATAIESSTAILRKTSDERRQGLAALRSTIEDDELASHNLTPAFPSPSSPARAKSAGPAESSQAPASKKPIAKKPAVLKSSVPDRKGKGPALDSDGESEAGVESDDGDHSREINFEELDRTSQDEMSDEDPGDDIGGELDDEFQPGDLLGIRVKYNYDVNLPQQIVRGTGSIKLSSYPGYSPTDFVFGQFSNLPEHIPSRVTTPEGLAKLILAFKDALATSTIQDEVFEKLPAPVTSTSTADENPPATTHSAAPHTSPALDGPHLAQAPTKPTTPTTESPTPTVETSPRVAETDTATAEATGTSGPRTRTRPKMRPPPNTEPAEPPTANPSREDPTAEQLSSGPQGSTEALVTEAQTAGLGAKRKRGPNSPKAPTRASARKRAQTGTQDNTQASLKVQETTAAGGSTPATTRSQRKQQSTGVGTVARSLRPRKR
ncbi:putative ATP-dependent helicase DinG homolog [Bacillus subtilis subsp, subtilis str. 168] [Rhizoctonia solani]|uniref:Putative ATP-dependent helicase DinG homolog [Bacillus subtilis subsp, subtilis str. 168] n=1 Tax=Rhizoctonia solani TaxID=456999 RepID=A0A0K6GFB8_9AGAM|nr:putative ATP-dependent helicase DinG homolog [Bacillus subtilis subsp, subtilis str. 168] [Rhizoctonia solani]